MKRAGGVS